MYSIDLAGKTGLVFGVANQRSIAWAIADRLNHAGARMAFSYQGERLRPVLEKLTKDCRDPLLLECDVTDDQQLDDVFSCVQEEFGKLDFLIHAVAYAPRESFMSPFLHTKRGDWAAAMDISAYSLVATAQRAAPLMTGGGSILTLSYLAAERVVPKYNLMGVAKAALEAAVRFLAYDLGPQQVRVNAISAGPLKTIAARSIPGFGDMATMAAAGAPMKRNITHDEVGGLALALVSDALGSGITGETIYVDAGYHTMGMLSTSQST